MRTARNKTSLVRAAALSLGAVALLTTGWQPFKKPDPDVRRGNQLIQKKKPAEALKAYQKAEKRLGRRHRLDYNRGLAHFGKGELKKAREAFLSATGATDKRLRKQSFFNLANTLFRLAKPTVKHAQKAATAVTQAEAAIAQFSGESQKQQRCKAMAAAAKSFKAAVEANQSVVAAFKKARNEYRLVLIRDPKHFDAKWNMELALRHMGNAETANKQLAVRAKALAERFKKECKPPDDKKKKKNKDKQNKDKQNKDKQNKDKQNKDKQNKDKQNKDKQNKDKQNKDKQNKDKQNKDKQNKDKQNKDKQKKNAKQKPLSKEDIAKRKASKKLDRLERKQRDRDRRRDRGRTTRRPLKDW